LVRPIIRAAIVVQSYVLFNYMGEEEYMARMQNDWPSTPWWWFAILFVLLSSAKVAIVSNGEKRRRG